MPNPPNGNPARPPAGAVLATLSDIAPGAAIVRDYREGDAWYSLLIARDKDGAARVYENICPHAQSPLERFDGRVLVQERRYLVCAMHGASFRIDNGECVGGPALGLCLTSVDHIIDGDHILLA